jgi:hypothetical protein
LDLKIMAATVALMIPGGGVRKSQGLLLALARRLTGKEALP